MFPLCLAVYFGCSNLKGGVPVAAVHFTALSQSRGQSSAQHPGAAKSSQPHHRRHGGGGGGGDGQGGGLRRASSSLSSVPVDRARGGRQRQRRSTLAAGVALALGFGASLAAALARGEGATAATATGETLASLEVAGSVDEEVFPIWESAVSAAAVRQVIVEAGPQGAELGSPEADWPGLWRVVHAPHIKALGSLALTRFDVYYDISPAPGGGLGVRSFVRFEGPLWSGWLNAAGGVSEVRPPLEVPGLGSRPTSEINFTDFWVDWGARLPRAAPSASDDVLKRIARPFFFRDLSRFPTLLFDASLGLTIFRFPPLGVEIAAKRVGPSGDAVRAMAA